MTTLSALVSTPGADRVIGDAGDDNLRGRADSDRIFGNADTNNLDGAADTDYCYSSTGSNTYTSCEVLPAGT